MQIEIPISTQIVAPKKQKVEIVEEDSPLENTRVEDLGIIEDATKEEIIEEIFEDSF